MKTLYKCICPLTMVDSLECLKRDVWPVLAAWVNQARRKNLPVPPGLVEGKNLQDFPMGDGFVLTALHNREETTHALRLEHPDGDTPTMHWLTEICLHWDGSQAWLQAIVGVRYMGETPMHDQRLLTSPGVVVQLLKRFSRRNINDLASEVKWVRLDENSMRHFVGFVEAADRKHPIIFVTPENSIHQVSWAVDRMAARLAGLAHVVVPENGFVTKALVDQGLLRKEMVAFDGAVRIYWPGFKQTDDPRQHRLWMPGRVSRHLAMDANPGDFIFRDILEPALLRADKVSWMDLVMQIKLAEVQGKDRGDDWKELASIYEQENTRLKGQLEETLEWAATYERRATQAENDREYWKDQALTALRNQPESKPEEELRPIEDMADALARAAQEFDGELVLALNTQSEGEKSLYRSPQEVYRALAWLASDYRQARLGVKPLADMDLSLRTACEWKYLGRHSSITMRTYPNWYETNVGGVTYELDLHIGRGSDKEPRHSIRMGFAWDDDLKKTVVGYLGQHQKTDAT